MSCAGGGRGGLPGIPLQPGASNWVVVTEFCSLFSSPKSPRHPSAGAAALGWIPDFGVRVSLPITALSCGVFGRGRGSLGCTVQPTCSLEYAWKMFE